ncbi:MAG: response regulator transcription factor [Chroococcidiopsidaceae cyanobacterium CP_BM_ER_R8_30]|nr:response regulator transcription factor [Chroococcidiopsidaceae cyanobacterium CP_BM_ER_R8_30]
MIDILIVDDQRVIREGIRALLEPESDLHVVGEASNGRVAIEQIEALRPDVALIDIQMPEMDGISATQIITQRFAETKVLVLSGHDSEEHLAKALEAGAKGYILKDIAAAELSNAIRTVHRGYAKSGLGLTENLAQTNAIKALILDRVPSELPALVSDSLALINQELAELRNRLDRYSVNLDTLTKAQEQFERNNGLKGLEEKLKVFRSEWAREKQAILTALNEQEIKFKTEQMVLRDELSHWLSRNMQQEIEAMQTRLTVALWLVFLVLGISAILSAFKH